MMATFLIYESPKKDKQRSEPIAIDDRARRRVLERNGWRIVERTGDAPIGTDAVPARDPGATFDGDYDALDDGALWELANKRGIEALRDHPEGVSRDELIALHRQHDAGGAAPARPFAFLSDEQWTALQQAGFDSEAAIHAATDDQLRDVKGIGPAAVRDIRKELAGPVPPPAT